MSENAKSIAVTVESRGSGLLAWRLLLAAGGIVCVGVGYVGIALPGVPTVGPLLLASILFAKSCPVLERTLIRNRVFARFLPYLDGQVEMPRRAKLATIATMWSSILISTGLLVTSGIGGRWLPALLILAGMVGTVFISRYGRKRA